MARKSRSRLKMWFRIATMPLRMVLFPLQLIGRVLMSRRIRSKLRRLRPLGTLAAHLMMLPFDLVFLVYDFLFTNLRKTKLSRRSCRYRQTPSGEAYCRPSLKYTNRFLFRLICKDVTVGTRVPICTAKGKRLKIYFVRGAIGSALVVAVLVGAVWLLVSYWPRLVPQEADREAHMRLTLSRLESADSAFEAGDYEKARGLYARVLSGSPELSEANYRMALCYEKLGDVPMALRHFEAAARADLPVPDAAERAAFHLFCRGEVSEAVRYAQRTLELDPARVLAQALLADQMTGQGSLDEAQEALKPALDSEPDDPLVKVVQARLLAAQGELTEAEQILKGIPRTSPLALLAAARLADVHLKANRPESAMQTLRTLIADNPDRPGPVVALVNLLFATGKTEEGYKEAEDALVAFYRDYRIKLAIAEVLRAYGRQGRALQVALECTQQRDQAARAHALAADIYLERGLWELAEEHARTALQADPTHTGALLCLGRALLALDRKDAAIDVFETLTDTDARNVGGWTWLGVSLRREGRPREAEAPLRKAIDLEPASGPLHEELGRALVDQGKSEEGTKCLERAVELFPSLYTAHTRLGMLAEQRGETAEAARHYEAAIAAAPSLAVVASVNLANILLEENRNLPMALAMAHFAFSAPRSQPYGADAAETFAHALLKMGYVGNAETVARYAVKLAPESAVNHYRLATVLQQLGNTEEALAECRKALESDPDFRPARDLATSLTP